MKWMLRLVYVIFLIRFIFALMPSFQVDMSAWLAWAQRLDSVGFANFYTDDVWTQYTPGFLYWLWIVGKLNWINPLSIKIPTILSEIVTALLMWKVVSKTNLKWGIVVFVFYMLSPVSIIDGSIWGQIDGVLSLAMYSSVYFLLEKNNYKVSAALIGIALLIKPQAVAVFPVLGILILQREGVRRTIIYSLIVATLVVAGFYPFYPNNPILGMMELFHMMGASYPYTSLFAFNIWSYVGMWIADSTQFFGFSYFTIGVTMMIGAYLALILKYRSELNDNTQSYLLLALACYIFFLFPTRVHERYLFPMFAYLITYVGLQKNKSLLIASIVAAIVYALNLYYPYSYYESAVNPLKNIAVEIFIKQNSFYIATAQIVIFSIFWLLPARKNLEKSIPISTGKQKAIKHRSNNKKTKNAQTKNN